MRKILIFTALFLSAFILPAQVPVTYPDPSIFGEDSDAYINLQSAINEAIGNITIALMPFDGAYGVNMRDTRYPARDVDGNKMLTYADISLNSFSSTSNLDKYNDEQMILMGGVEGVPSSLVDGIVFDTRSEEVSPWVWQEKPNFLVRVAGGIKEVTVTVNSSTDFMYVSQSNPIYQREYRLYVVPSSASGSNLNDYPGNVIRDPFSTISKTGKRNADLKFNSNNLQDDYLYSWFDLVLGLPYDQVNETGVILDNVEYPLADSKDYSSVITVNLSWEQPFEIIYNKGKRGPLGYYRDEDWDYANPIGTGTIKLETSLSIPFSGFSSTIDIGPSDDTGSLTVMLTPAASNLSLNDADTNREVKVAEIDFIMNLPNYIKDGNGNYYDRETKQPIDISTNVWLFLSASPDPANSNSNGFVLVHENAGNMLTSYNSASYEVITKGLRDSAHSADGNEGGEVIFDGKAKDTDFTAGGGASDAYIHTYCNATDGTGSFLPHEAGSFSADGKSFTSNDYHHYHEYHGEVYVKIEPTALKPEGMRAGRYTSEIYVHVMTSD